MNEPANQNGARERILRYFERVWLERGRDTDRTAKIESGLDAKLGALEARDDDERKPLRAAVDQLRQLWENRGQLEAKHVAYIGAALLYFISPLDALPDIIPGLGLADDLIVVTTVLGMVLKAVSKGGDILKDRAEQVVRNAEAAAERAADDVVPRAVASVSVALWGATTAAALSLAVAVITGGVAADWAVYIAVVAALAVLWNLAAAWRFAGAFGKLSGPARERLLRVFAARIGWRHVVVLGVPLALLIGLALVRVLPAAG